MSKLDEIRERLEAATEGPWDWCSELWQLRHMTGKYVCTEVLHAKGTLPTDNDAEFIANAPTDIAYLLAEVERLRGVVTTATIACGAVDLEAAEDIDRWRDNWGEVIRDEVLDATQRVRAILEGKT